MVYGRAKEFSGCVQKYKEHMLHGILTNICPKTHPNVVEYKVYVRAM